MKLLVAFSFLYDTLSSSSFLFVFWTQVPLDSVVIAFLFFVCIMLPSVMHEVLHADFALILLFMFSHGCLSISFLSQSPPPFLKCVLPHFIGEYQHMLGAGVTHLNLLNRCVLGFG